MAYTTPATGNILKKWETDYFAEYVRESGFNPYMGSGTNSPFVVKKQLIQGGQVITVPLVSALTGSNVGTGTLVGNEESLGNYSYDLKPYWHRYAVAIKKSDEQNSVIDLLNASRDMLKVRDMDDMRDSIINALSSVVEASSSYTDAPGHSKEVFFSEATTAQKNTWTAANQYRILFGNAEANYNATFATGAGNVDTTNDKFSVTSLALLKRMAKRRFRIQKGDAIDLPSIRPIRTGTQGREFFVCFAGPETFADLKLDMRTINLDGRPRDPESNPIFQDGDLIVDGAGAWHCVGSDDPCHAAQGRRLWVRQGRRRRKPLERRKAALQRHRPRHDHRLLRRNLIRTLKETKLWALKLVCITQTKSTTSART